MHRGVVMTGLNVSPGKQSFLEGNSEFLTILVFQKAHGVKSVSRQFLGVFCLLNEIEFYALAVQLIKFCTP